MFQLGEQCEERGGGRNVCETFGNSENTAWLQLKIHAPYNVGELHNDKFF